MRQRRRRRRRRNNDATAMLIMGALRWLWRHPLLVSMLLLSTGIGILTDYLLSVPTNVQLIVSGGSLTAMAVVYWQTHMEYAAVYIIIALHPITGRRVCAWVGMTTQDPWVDGNGVKRYPRIEQHIVGSDYYDVSPKSWNDTVIRWYFLVEGRYLTKQFILLVEYVFIKLRKPLYNTQHNTRNGRRISPQKASSLRAERDAGIYTEKYWKAMQRHTPYIAQ